MIPLHFDALVKKFLQIATSKLIRQQIIGKLPLNLLHK